jgi:hypothetical protein
MRFSTWGRNALACLVAATVVIMASRSEAQWRVIPEVRLSGGGESDLVIDPGVSRVVVPGGTFAELTPRLAARGWIGRDGILDLGTSASFQRFFNDESRCLYAQTIWGDLYQGLGRSFRGRLSTALDYFNDSEQSAVKRVGYGAEAGFGYVRPFWNVELWGGVSDRSYPDLSLTTTRGQSSTYAETAWSGAGTLRIAPAGRVSARVDAIYQATDALDSFYDSRSWTASGSIDGRLVSSLFITVSGAYQRRDFVDRTAPEHEDEYAQAGVGMRYTVAPGWMILARAAFSNYTWPDGSDVDSRRFSVGVSYAWGRRAAPPPPRVDVDAIVRESRGAIQKPDARGFVLFRIQAPSAANVSVVGTFNEWASGATPLARTADGWWEARAALAPGTYEYLYLVDGTYVTPPESIVTVEDGFGRRNGVLEVVPPGK